MSVVIISGMHRSGTSLLANLFQESGLHIGDRLLEGTFSNQKGHFEDADFKDFHDSVLNAIDPLLLYIDQEFQISSDQRAQAASLIEFRSGLPCWGWKDPRTVLFLDMWQKLLPDAQFVFVFRRPELVVDSLRRRNTDPPLFWQWKLPDPFPRLGMRRFRLKRALNMWCSYNDRLLQFMKKYPDQSVLLNLEDLEVGLPKILSSLQQRGFDLQDVDLAEVYDSSLLKQNTDAKLIAACQQDERAQALLNQLEQLAI